MDRESVELLMESVELFGLSRVWFLIFGIFVLGLVSGVEVDESILEKFDEGEERVAVIVEEGNDSLGNGMMRMNSVGVE